MNMNNKIFSSILVIALAVLLTVTVVFAWEEPNTAPPGGNVYAPLNTSINAQAKDGALVVGYGLSAGDDAFIVANGNVGIGTTDPQSYKLFVKGNVYIDDMLEVYDNIHAFGDLFFDNSSWAPIIQTTYAQDLRFGTNNTRRMILTKDGYLVLLNRFQIGNESLSWINDPISGYSNGIYTNDGIIFTPLHNSSRSDFRMYITDDANDSFSIWGNTCGGGSCDDLNHASIVAMFKAGGFVGIAEENPSQRLDIKGAIRLQPSSAPYSQNGVIYYDSSLGKFRCYENRTWKDCIQEAGTTLWTDAGTYIYPNNDDQFVITDTGNVGIGTTNPPGAKLDVAGQVKTNSIYVNAGEGLEIENGGSGYGPNDSRRINLRDGNPPTDGALVITSDVSSPSDAGNLIAYFDRNKAAFLGNVGIGTTNPGQKLDVAGQVHATGDICTDQSGGVCLSTAAGGVSGSGSANYIPKWTGSTSLGNSAIYQSGSNIGIGTASPNNKLEVQNGAIAIRYDNQDSKLRFHDPGNAWYSMGIDVSDSRKFKINYGGNVGDNSNFTMTTSGNVGIGTTNPNDKLEVSGNVRANRLTDRDNTNYYIDPNGTSRLSYTVSNGYDFSNERDLRSGGDGRLFRYGGQASMSFDDWLYMYDSNDGGLTNIKFNVDSEAVYAKAFYYSSDKNLKYNIEPLNGSLSKILELEPVAFNWKDDDKISIGLIAQDVEKIFPEVVSGEEGSKVVNYGILVAPLIEAVKEQQKEIDELKAEIEALKLKIK